MQVQKKISGKIYDLAVNKPYLFQLKVSCPDYEDQNNLHVYELEFPTPNLILKQGSYAPNSLYYKLY